MTICKMIIALFFVVIGMIDVFTIDMDCDNIALELVQVFSAIGCVGFAVWVGTM